MHSRLKSMARGVASVVFHERILVWIIALTDVVLANQWRKAQGLHSLRRVRNVGSNVRFLGRVQVFDPEKLTLGSHVRVGKGCFLFCKGGLDIGDGTIISRNVTIYTANHETESPSVPYGDQYRLKSVRIGKGVWIGMNASIVPGVSVGDGAVIGMGTVVSSDVEPGAIVVGASTRVVKRRPSGHVISAIERTDYFAKKWPEL